MDELKQILEYFPEGIYKEILKLIDDNNTLAEYIQEIRLRTNKPIAIKTEESNKLLKHKVSQEEMLKTFEKICENSIYSYKKQICEGFITVKGGHRIGITGNAFMEGNEVANINYISSLNFRIARQKLECSNNLVPYVIKSQENTIFNTLIVSPPGAGKTTMLRDLIRKLSNGIREINFKGKNIGLVDERGEIAAMYKGIPQNDIGLRTDIIDNVSKAKGMKMLIRSMAPDIISCDEIGSCQDVEAINYAICSGVKGIFTAHGGSLEEIITNPDLENLIKKYIFERIIFLNPNKKGEIMQVYALDLKNKEYKTLI